MYKYNRIIICGDGWGAIAVYNGLISSLCPIYTCSNDDSINTMSTNQLNDNINDLKNELIIFAGYKPIVPKHVLDNNMCINIHYSLLPKYRGYHSTVWALLNNEPYLGLTIHLMNEYIDDGPIIYQYSVENDFKTNAREYMEMFNSHITNRISTILSAFLDGRITPVKQDKSKASWVGKRTEKDCQIDFTRNINYQKAFFRALVKPYPLPYFEYKGEKIIVTNVDFHLSTIETHIGRILNIDNEGVWVKCLDGYIIIKSMEDINGNSVNYSRFRIGQYFNK